MYYNSLIKKSKDINGNTIHDTEKPVELMKILIENSSHEGDVVFEPFGGIMATALAAKELNRKFVAFELDEKYCSIGIDRLKDF